MPMMELDFSPFFISLKTGIIATIFAFFLGLFGAVLVMRVNKIVRYIIDGIFTLPLVLPPTVAGFFLLLLFSMKRPFGKFLYESWDIKIVQSWEACVIAATVIAFPLMYRNARAAFEQVDPTMIYAARTLGLSEFKILYKIVIPLAAPGIASGMILTFARSIGEYGATSMLAGNILGKTRTIAIAIATDVAAGNMDRAGMWVTVIILLSFVIVFAMNLISGLGMKQIRGWK